MDKRSVARELMKIAKSLVSVSGDPYWITVRYPGECAKCGAAIRRGEKAFYYPRGKKMYGKRCGHGAEAESDFLTQSAMDRF